MYDRTTPKQQPQNCVVYCSRHDVETQHPRFSIALSVSAIPSPDILFFPGGLQKSLENRKVTSLKGETNSSALPGSNEEVACSPWLGAERAVAQVLDSGNSRVPAFQRLPQSPMKRGKSRTHIPQAGKNKTKNTRKFSFKQTNKKVVAISVHISKEQ